MEALKWVFWTLINFSVFVVSSTLTRSLRAKEALRLFLIYSSPRRIENVHGFCGKAWMIARNSKEHFKTLIILLFIVNVEFVLLQMYTYLYFLDGIGVFQSQVITLSNCHGFFEFLWSCLEPDLICTNLITIIWDLCWFQWSFYWFELTSESSSCW